VDHHLRHRSASGGSLTNHFDFDWSDHTIICSIQVASAQLVHVALRVLPIKRRNRLKGEYGIWSLSSSNEVWRLEQGVYDDHLPPPHPLLPLLTLVLTNTPAAVAWALANL
jgi:hypothetical protein